MESINADNRLVPLFSSDRMDWETPDDLFAKLDAEFHFDLDVCATKENAKVPMFYSPEIDGLKQVWDDHTCWMNPPYGRAIGIWVKKAFYSARSGATVVALLPSRTDTKWFHEYILGKSEIRFISGRVKFKGGNSCAPFPSMIVIWHPDVSICWTVARYT